MLGMDSVLCKFLISSKIFMEQFTPSTPPFYLASFDLDLKWKCEYIWNNYHQLRKFLRKSEDFSFLFFLLQEFNVLFKRAFLCHTCMFCEMDPYDFKCQVLMFLSHIPLKNTFIWPCRFGATARRILSDSSRGDELLHFSVILWRFLLHFKSVGPQICL